MTRVPPLLRAALAALLIALPASVAVAQTSPATPLVATGVAWPTEGGVTRNGGNGLSIDGGVAEIDESTQYALAALGVDADGVIRFTYADTWTLERPEPSYCDFTFRRVERGLTQAGANALARRLAGIELGRLKGVHTGLTSTGDQTTEGTAVTRVVDRFTWPEEERTVVGLSKTWIFVRDAKAYYVNKTCVSPVDADNLIVIDQLIGLNYRIDPVPAT